ncbi:MAG: pyridoxamine 5'-phosphate oxidase family protein [Proteobacteria bacterium]|nr:pyridoxamine 5'-phosphate oxidase family protein [Pseudomonadota bacterium]
MTQEGPFEGARALLRGCRYGTLATLAEGGAPFASLVALASDERGAPLLLLSDLARHTQNLKRDGRASLLLDGSEGRRERLAAARLTLTGTIAPAESQAASRRYLAVHPEAARLLELADFRFYRLEPDAGHLVAGFGRIDTIAAADFLVPAALAADLAQSETGAIEHMHADHADAVDLLAGAPGGRIGALDADGMDLVAGTQAVRCDYAARLGAAADLRVAIVELVRKARKS